MYPVQGVLQIAPPNVTRKTGGNQAGSASHRSTKASGRQRDGQASSQRRTLPQPLGPSSALEELLSRTRYSVTPQFRRQLIRGKLQALGYELYDEVPGVARPIAPRPVEQQVKKSRRKIRRGYDDEDLSDEELDVGHLPLTNPSYSRQLTANTHRPTLRKATTARMQEDSNRDKPVRGAKKMSASRESYGVNTPATAPTVGGSDEEVGTQDMNTDSSMLMGGSDEEQGTMDYVPTGSRPLFLPDDPEVPPACPPPSGTLWAKRPATPLIEAFEEVDMDGRYRAGIQAVSGRLPFLKRNMRAVFERRAQRRRNLKASAAGYPEVAFAQASKGGPLYDIGIVLDEESILERSRRAKKIVLQLESLYLPTNYAPYACTITVELHLKRNEGLAMRLSLLHADITIPRPQQEQGARYAINFQPPLKATSELLTFWSIPPPFTASGATVVITLSGFQGPGGRPLPWVLPGSASSPAGVGEKAEISLDVVSDDEPALFVSAERKIVPLEWIEGRNLPQREADSLMTAALSLSWEFEPTGKCLPPLSSLQESHASLVVIEFRHNDNVWKTKQFGWRCPLCDRFGAFSDAFFLECHIQVHHEQVEPVIDEDAARTPRVILTARPLQRAATTPFPASEGTGYRTRSPTSVEQDPLLISRYESARDKAPNRRHGEDLEDAEMGSSSGPSAVLPSAAARLRTKMPPGHPPSLDFVPNVNTALEQNLGTVVPGPAIIIDLTRDSPEPAPKDPLGPADTLKGGTYTSAYDSSVFDILSELSLDVLGNQANRITTQLEQIYAHRELPVEDRVIAALWARWIALNRGKFLASYVEGFKAFVLESHDVIRRAAGVRALRNFLLVMAQYRFLKPKEVCDVLDAYGNQIAGGVRDQ
ncbi:hypothetical protein FS837_010114 [Tulasnella sp. UAMH 9824]|nr:hypothetical protein FS837_010114 [Tulasnella sp. UAMH 9824]